MYIGTVDIFIDGRLKEERRKEYASADSCIYIVR